jgi:hypothetical protein
MATMKQEFVARHHIKNAAAAASNKKTFRHLSKRARTTLGKQGAKMAKSKRG